MSRPSKFRKICALPSITEFGPRGIPDNSITEVVFMSVDEYETLRLIDYEELTQEACAVQMNVARTTAQKIYATARKKMITMLVTGAELKIQGGKFEICSEKKQGLRCGRCRRLGNHNNSGGNNENFITS